MIDSTSNRLRWGHFFGFCLFSSRVVSVAGVYWRRKSTLEETMDRRSFLIASASLPAAFAAQSRLPIRKALYAGMLPRNLSFVDRFKLARDTGFEAVECDTAPEQKTAEEIKQAAEAAGVRIHSVMNQSNWKFPLSS